MRPRKRILLIDPSEEQHFDWTLPLDLNGYHVTASKTPDDARRLELKDVDLVVTKSPIDPGVLLLARRLRAPVMVLVPASPRIETMAAVKKMVTDFRGPQPGFAEEVA